MGRGGQTLLYILSLIHDMNITAFQAYVTPEWQVGRIRPIKECENFSGSSIFE